MSAIFGCVIPGCPVITQFVQTDATHWTAPLGNAPESLVVFLTGSQPIPHGYALGVYIANMNDGAYEYVGHLTNECPSSIFRTPSSFLNLQVATPITLGLSLETLETVQNLGVNVHQPADQTRATSYMNIAQRIAEDLYTFLSSYAKTLSADPNDPQSEETVYLPMRWCDQWKQRLDKKILKDTAFWS